MRSYSEHHIGEGVQKSIRVDEQEAHAHQAVEHHQPPVTQDAAHDHHSPEHHHESEAQHHEAEHSTT